MSSPRTRAIVLVGVILSAVTQSGCADHLAGDATVTAMKPPYAATYPASSHHRARPRPAGRGGSRRGTAGR